MSRITSVEAPEKVPNKSLTAGYVHLHNHSHYSLLDGLQKIPQMLDRAKEQGMDAIALTDHGTMCGAIEFYNEAKKRGIKPIFGMEAYVAPRGMGDKNGKLDANPYHLILLAYNYTGYQNLMLLSTEAHLNGFYYKPRIDRDLLTKHHEGLICLSACASGEVGRNILDGNIQGAKETIEWYRETFGTENYFLEMQNHATWEPQQRINKAILELGSELDIPVVVTGDSHYTLPTDHESHEILLCIQTGKDMDDPTRMSMDMPLFMEEPSEIAKKWIENGHPEVCSNTVKIAERCNVELQLDQILIPKFETPTGESERDYLQKLVWQGAMWRYGNIAKEDISLYTPEKAAEALPEKIANRVRFELEVIGRMNYEGYFLIVADFINWGKNRDIIFGPGRGSAAGSIIAYSLNITDLDPLEYDLLFERFLNPDRISMPDIDIDIQDTRRDEVIQYVIEKYGEDRVAQIITFGKIMARNAVRDTGRALGMPYAEVDAIAKLVPQPIQGRHIPLAKSIVEDPELSQIYKDNPRAKRLIDAAIPLEGTIRSNGVHAAGVVIAPNKIVEYLPLQRAQKGGISTQYDMGPVEQIGLLKMDFLGLSNLTIINNTLRIIRKIHGKNINIADIPLDDRQTYELLSKGDTTGIFQLESAGMKRYLKALQPTKFDDIIAMCALYRPGPMQFIDDFIERKHGRKKVVYEHPGMESALKNTYGILVYQEQFMQISKEMCGFTGGQADTLRKAIGKKQRATMAKMKTAFIDGMVEHSKVEREFAETFWGTLEAFADYCFNKSHSACYALIAVWTAYLKAHYPAPFMAALMTSNHDNIDKIALEIAECKRMGLEVLPPDVNESFLEFSVVKDSSNIRFGLVAVKNVGVGPIEAVLEARQKGEFKSVEDFAKRVSSADFNRKAWESLIKTGAMDSFGDRGKLLHNLDTITTYASKAQKDALSGQIDIFGSLGIEEKMPALRLELPPRATSTQEQLAWERELLGLYISHHPLDDYQGYLQDHVVQLAEITPEMEGQPVTIGGIITTVRKITTKNNATMAFVGIEDKTSNLELIVFPKAYEKTPQLWQPDHVVEVKGKINTKDRDGRLGSELKIMVDSAKMIDYDSAKEYKGTGPKAAAKVPKADPTLKPKERPEVLVIKLETMTDTGVLTIVKDVLTKSPGNTSAYLVMPGTPPKKILLPFKVELTDELVEELQKSIADGKVMRFQPQSA